MIFITGANGLLGSFIARAFLLNGNNNIVALKRPESDLSQVEDFKDQISWVDGNILDMLMLEQQTKEVEIFIHCAGKVSFDKNDKDELYNINVEGTKNVVNTCLKNNVPKLIFISSISTFGSQKSIGTISELSKKDIDNLGSNYAVTKYLAELEVWRGNIEGLETVIINPSVVLGPGNWQSSSVRLFDYVWKESLFAVNGHMNCVDVRDVADIVYRLCQMNIKSEQYIVNAERIAYKDLFVKIAKQFNKKPPRIVVPQLALEVLYGADQLRSFLTGKKAKVTKEIKNAAKGNQQFSSYKIKKALEFEFRPIEETIRWTCLEMHNKERLQKNP
jgi:dihydroflavonol-4-reductase